MTTAGMNSSGATLGLSQSEMPNPEPMAQPVDQRGIGYAGDAPASQPAAPMDGVYSGHTQPGQPGFGAPQPAPMAPNPQMGQMPAPGAAPEFSAPVASATGGQTPPMAGQMPPQQAMPRYMPQMQGLGDGQAEARPPYQPAYPQFGSPYQAGMPPIHTHATPENPLALPPQHTTTDMGPDRPPSGGGQPSAPAKKGGLLGRLRRR